MRIKSKHIRIIIVIAVLAIILFITIITVVVSKWMKKGKEIELATAPENLKKEEYSVSEIKEKEEYENEFIEQTPRAKTESENTYRIFNDTCSISYNYGKDWIKVPVAIEKLCDTAYGMPYQNKLQEGSYIINNEKAVFTFGGTEENELSIIKSTDNGKIWKTIAVENKDKTVRYAGQKFISFPSKNVGYIVVTSERAMASEGKLIFRTTNAGDTFTRVKVETNINDHFLHNAVFLTEKLGFMSMVCNDEPELYRTDDGGKNWEIIKIPVATVEGITPFTQPEVPYKKDGKLYLMVGQGADVDYMDGCKAKYVSDDGGKSFQYTNKVEK